MKKSDNDALRHALIEMSGAGQGETGSEEVVITRFLPLAEHSRVFEPETFLVIGHRGAGKTELFRALRSPEGVKAIASVSKRIRADDLGRARWMVGYSNAGTEFPAGSVLEQFTRGRSPIDLQFIWLGYLLRVLARQSTFADVESEIVVKFGAEEISVESIFDSVKRNLEPAFWLLDRLDNSLERNNSWIFITYDELDRVSTSDWDQLATIVRGLIQFWSSNARRWKRLRPKIFLRKDLYDRSAIVGPDVSKISAQRLELTWSPRDLYALLAKRFVNQAPDLVKTYLDEALPAGEMRVEQGWYPTAIRLEDYAPMIVRICGEFMGASAGKGRTFSWIPTHLQDGHGQVLPRSFLRLFEKAADIEQRNPRAIGARLLHHSSLRGALDQVSVDRVEEFKEELPWIDRVRVHLLKVGMHVPIERHVLARELNSIDWSTSADRPPRATGYDLVQFLGDLGIFYLRPDDRVDVRDIYLDGFGFKRKGGVRKPF